MLTQLSRCWGSRSRAPIAATCVDGVCFGAGICSGVCSAATIVLVIVHIHAAATGGIRDNATIAQLHGH